MNNEVFFVESWRKQKRIVHARDMERASSLRRAKDRQIYAHRRDGSPTPPTLPNTGLQFDWASELMTLEHLRGGGLLFQRLGKVRRYAAVRP